MPLSHGIAEICSKDFPHGKARQWSPHLLACSLTQPALDKGALQWASSVLHCNEQQEIGKARSLAKKAGDGSTLRAQPTKCLTEFKVDRSSPCG